MMLPILKSTTLLFSTLISLKSFGGGVGADLPDVENVPPPAAEAAPASPPHAVIDPAFVTPPDQPTKPASTNAPGRKALEALPLLVFEG